DENSNMYVGWSRFFTHMDVGEGAVQEHNSVCAHA
ncbi:MAG: hypothetical protein ACI8WB_004791, partial [Phenylobacterium sp.]